MITENQIGSANYRYFYCIIDYLNETGDQDIDDFNPVAYLSDKIEALLSTLSAALNNDEIEKAISQELTNIYVHYRQMNGDISPDGRLAGRSEHYLEYYDLDVVTSEITTVRYEFSRRGGFIYRSTILHSLYCIGEGEDS